MTIKTKKKNTTVNLTDIIVDALQEKKGHDIVVMDLRTLPHAVCDYFVICSGNSSTQVSALADSVDHLVKKKMGEDAWHTEGYQNAEWILLDYVNVVVHIFQPEARKFYGIEKLWADAPAQTIES
jgi:ribosome-associated protein